MIAHPGISGIIYRRTPPLRKNPQNLGYNWGFWGTMPQLLEDSNEALALASLSAEYYASISNSSVVSVGECGEPAATIIFNLFTVVVHIQYQSGEGCIDNS